MYVYMSKQWDTYDETQSRSARRRCKKERKIPHFTLGNTNKKNYGNLHRNVIALIELTRNATENISHKTVLKP